MIELFVVEQATWLREVRARLDCEFKMSGVKISSVPSTTGTPWLLVHDSNDPDYARIIAPLPTGVHEISVTCKDYKPRVVTFSFSPPVLREDDSVLRCSEIKGYSLKLEGYSAASVQACDTTDLCSKWSPVVQF